MSNGIEVREKLKRLDSLFEELSEIMRSDKAWTKGTEVQIYLTDIVALENNISDELEEMIGDYSSVVAADDMNSYLADKMVDLFELYSELNQKMQQFIDDLVYLLMKRN